jgi:hypothetical protein
VAKKRKGARPAASRGAKKTARKTKTTKKAVRKAAPRKRPTGLDSDTEIDFRPLKTHLRAHIAKLSSAKAPSLAIQKALESLKQAQDTLTSECLPTMVIPFQ